MIIRVISVVEAIVVLFCLSIDYEKVFSNVRNKELLSNIMSAWTVLGVLAFVIEKLILIFLDWKKLYWQTLATVMILIMLLLTGLFITVLNIKKKEWKYWVDL